MARIMKLGTLLPIFLVISVSAFGKSFDGQWLIDKEVSMNDCLLVIKSNAENDGEYK